MAGPGGREVGRLRVKVVPDTDGFAADLKTFLERQERNKLEIDLKLETGTAEEKIASLSRNRNVTLNIKVDDNSLSTAEAKIAALARDRDVNLKVKADVRSASTSINNVLRDDRGAEIKVRANTRTAQNEINRLTGQHEATIKLEFRGDEAVQRAKELTADQVQRVHVVLDDKNAKTQLRVLGKNSEIIAKLDVDQKNLAEIDNWLIGLGGKFRDASQEMYWGVRRAQRILKERDLVRQAEEFDKALKEADRDHIRTMQVYHRMQLQAAIRAARAQAREEAKAARQRERDLQRQAERLQQMVSFRISGDAAIRRLEDLTRDEVKRIQVHLDDSQAKAQLKVFGHDNRLNLDVEVNQDNLEEIRQHLRRIASQGDAIGDRLSEGFARARAEQQRLFVENSRFQRSIRRIASVVRVDLDGDNRVAARLAWLTRPRDVNIRADVDRSAIGRIGRVIGKTFTTAAGVGLGALGGLAQGIGNVTGLFGRFGNQGQKAFGRINDLAQQGAGKMGTFASQAASVVGQLLAVGATGAVLVAIVNILGSVIVAAIGAVAALASVLVGALALAAIPAIFAGIGVAMVAMGDEESKLRKQFEKLKETMVSTFERVGAPMVSFFSDTMERLNKNLKAGTPLYDQLAVGFDQATQALKPLRSGVKDFALNTLTGLNQALVNMNSSGAAATVSSTLGDLGSVIGNFAANLSVYSPEIANGASSLVSGLDRIQAALARWVGEFAGDAPAVINEFSAAVTRLLDEFSSNSDVFSQSATILGGALEGVAPAVRQVAEAFARMSPAIFDSLVAAINSFGDAISDPGTIDGLAQLTTMMIDFSSAILNFATETMGWFGKATKGLGDGFDLLTRNLIDGVNISQKQFQDLIEGESNARNKINKGLQQLNYSVRQSVENSGEWLVKYADQAVTAMEKVDGEGAEHQQAMAARLQTLAQEWDKAGGRVGQGWHDAFNQVQSEIAKGGNGALQLFAGHMADTVNKSEEFRNKLKANLVAALRAEGVPIDDSLLARIDQQLGLLTNSAETNSAQAVAKIQANFQRLPGILQAAMDEAKTPEQLKQKLLATQEVMDHMTPQIAESFAKLPTSMQETLTKSTAAFTAWTGMEAFKQKVTDGVTVAKTQFTSLATTIGQVGPYITILGLAMTMAAGNIQQLGAQLQTTTASAQSFSTTMGTIGIWIGILGNAASTATTNIGTLSARVNDASQTIRSAASSADSASSRLGSLGNSAISSGAGFRSFATAVSRSMTTAHQAVGSWTWAIEQRLAQMQSRSTSLGNLSGFVGSISRSMWNAYGIVSGAVSSMLAELQRLNTTVTATVRINRVETTTKRTIQQPSSSPTPNFAPNSFQPMSLIQPFDTFDAQTQEVTTRNAVSLRAAALEMDLRDERSSSTPERTYNFTTYAAPNEPTEKQFTKWMGYMDALHGE